MTPQRYSDADLWGPPLPAAAQRQRMSDGEAFGGPHQSGPPPKLKADQGLGFEWGAMHPLDNMAQWAQEGLQKYAWPAGPLVAKAIDWAGQHMGLPSPQQAAQQHQQAIQQAAAQGRRPGMVGQIAGNTLATLPVMAVTGNPMLGGAMSGAISTDNPHSLAGVARDTAIGAAAGKAGDMVAGGIGRLIQPKVRPAAQALIDQGVQLTPGQIMGGVPKWIEDASTHVPLAGQMIKNAQRQSVKTFNGAMINRSLAPIGEALPQGLTAGRQAVDYAANRLGQAFENAKPNVPVMLDDGFKQTLADAATAGRVLPSDTRRQLADILQSRITERVAPVNSSAGVPGGMNGSLFDPDAVQLTDRELGKMAASYGGSGNPDQQMLGSILGDVQDGFRDMVGRQDANYAAQIGKAREGWAQFVPIRNAASGVGAKEGVFTPSQMLSGIRRADSSAGKGAFARGTATGMDLTDAAQSVLPSQIPDSGTAGRGIIDLALLGGIGGGEHAVGINPLHTMASIGGLAAAYSPPALSAARYLLAGSRPAAAQALGDAIDQYGRPVATVGGASAAKYLADLLQGGQPPVAAAAN